MKRRFTVILETEPGGGYHVLCPSLPGCHSEGDTVEDALGNIREAIEAYLESLGAHGEPLPEDTAIIVASADVDTDAQTAGGHP